MKRFLSILLFSMIAALPALPGTIGYTVEVSTASFSGTPGFVDFFLSSPGLPPEISATVDEIAVDGSPTIPSVLNLSIDPALFDLQTLNLTYGSLLRFVVTLNSSGIGAPGNVNLPAFFVSLFDETGTPLIGDGQSAALALELTADGGVSVAAAQGVSAGVVPEPSTLLLAAASLGVVALLRRRSS